MAMLSALASDYADGKLLIVGDAEHQSLALRFLSLNAGAPLQALMRRCRALVSLGGTMQPLAHFTRQLRSVTNGCALSLSRACWRCRCPRALCSAASISRSDGGDAAELRELGALLLNVSRARLCPGGVVASFAS